MHSYLSVVLVELTVMVMRMDTGTFDTKLKSMVSRVAADRPTDIWPYRCNLPSLKILPKI